ncbi:MAG: hypothetical protein JWQ40_4483 [Segetibacter sp.]|nr:hypothetical protein [Segetibacter sp.]
MLAGDKAIVICRLVIQVKTQLLAEEEFAKRKL